MSELRIYHTNRSVADYTNATISIPNRCVFEEDDNGDVITVIPWENIIRIDKISDESTRKARKWWKK
jgi:hypothetical protein